MKCKACGHEYADNLKNCPHCGCAKDASCPPYVSCPRCGTVMPARRKECPGCGLAITPQNARPARQPRHRTPTRPRLQPRQILVHSVAALLLAGLLAGEGYLVAGFYRQQAYRHTMELWNCGGTVEANRRTPDPVYRETETPELPDSLFDNLIDDEEAGDTIFTDNEPAEKATTGTDNVSQPEEVEALFD